MKKEYLKPELKTYEILTEGLPVGSIIPDYGEVDADEKRLPD